MLASRYLEYCRLSPLLLLLITSHRFASCDVPFDIKFLFGSAEWLTVAGKPIRFQWRLCRSRKKKLRGVIITFSLFAGISRWNLFKPWKSRGYGHECQVEYDLMSFFISHHPSSSPFSVFIYDFIFMQELTFRTLSE